MKTAVIPQVRVEPELRADLDSVLLPSGTIADFVETSVHRAVEFRRVRTDFAARFDAPLFKYERTEISVPSDVLLSKLEAKVVASLKQLRKLPSGSSSLLKRMQIDFGALEVIDPIGARQSRLWHGLASRTRPGTATGLCPLQGRASNLADGLCG